MRRIFINSVILFIYTAWVSSAAAFEVSPSKPIPPQEISPAHSDGHLVLYDPFDRENPLVKLPGVALTYTKGRDRGEAIYFDGKTYLKEPPLMFVPSGKNWIEGTVEFWVKPADLLCRSTCGRTWLWRGAKPRDIPEFTLITR